MPPDMVSKRMKFTTSPNATSARGAKCLLVLDHGRKLIPARALCRLGVRLLKVGDQVG